MIQFLGADGFDASRSGRKAANLHFLRVAGFQVPQGFVIYDGSQPTAEALQSAVNAIGGYPLAVRSSAALEDMAGASFAGQYQSFLNVSGIEELARRIADCLASAHSAPVRAYLAQKGLLLEKASMAVLVQKMVPAAIAGVGFSIHPLTGREEHALIEFCPGLGEKLVSGHTTPSNMVLRLEDGAVVQETAGDEPCELPTAARSSLTELLLKTQAHFGHPQDIEWAVDSGGRLWLLQSRPITHIRWRTDIEEYSNADLKDGGVSARVCTPLMFSLYESATSASMPRYFESIKLQAPGAPQEAWMRHLYGRVYWNAAAVKRRLSRIPGFSEEKFDQDLGIQKNYGEMGPVKVPTNLATLLPVLPVAIALEKAYKDQLRAIEDFGPAFEARRDELLAMTRRFGSMGDEEFFPALKDVLAGFHPWVEGSYFMTVYNNANAQSDFKSFLEKMDRASGAATPVVDLLGGLSDVSHMEMQKDMLALYDVAEAHGFDSAPWSEALERFITSNGFHADAELDLTCPRWAENPSRVKDIVAALIASGRRPTDPARAAAIQAARFDEAAASVSERLRASVKLRVLFLFKFRQQLRRVRTYLSKRERMREYSTQCYFIVRLFVLEGGRRLKALGKLTKEEDVFMLHAPELAALGLGPVDATIITKQIAYRRRLYEGYRDLIPPNELGRGVAQRAEESYRGDREGLLKGLGCSAGVVEGTVRVVESIEGIDGVKPGDILVTRFTDPGWTPVLGMVKGVVTEVGGMLSHAAVIGREYGIPAVLNLPGATRALRTGQKVRVDGSAGTVEVLQ